MTNLTEKWKNGELPNGRYYIETIPCEPCNVLGIPKYTDYYCIDSKFSYNITVKEVLAPIPSYEEWEEKQKALKVLAEAYCKEKAENQKLKAQIAKLTEIVGVLPSNHSVGNLGYKIKNQRNEINNRLKEIDKLKELLKECSPYVSRSATSRITKNSVGHKKDMKLFTQIDEVLK